MKRRKRQKSQIKHPERFHQLMDHFDSVEPYPSYHHQNAFLVNGEYIVAAIKKRWRNKGHGKWYHYRNIDHLKNFVYGPDQYTDRDPMEAIEDLESRLDDMAYDLDDNWEILEDRLEELEGKLDEIEKRMGQLESIH